MSFFMGNCSSYKDSTIVMAGAPMDFTCSFRPGARFGPSKIREVSYGLEEYSIYQNNSLDNIRFYDKGDLDIPAGNLEKSLEIIGAAVREIINDSKKPVILGGEHLVSLPVIKEMYDKYGDDLVIFQFDAHADLRDGYLGMKLSHASVIRRAADFINGKNIYQFGIRSGDKEEFSYAMKNTNMYKFKLYDPLADVVPVIGTRPVYLTIDIDVVDPAFACGTGTPEPCGITSTELVESVLLLKSLNIAGFDIVEVSPVYDISDSTAVLAAKVIRELLLICAK